MKDQSKPHQLYASALLIRSVEQKLLELFAAGKLFGTVHTCIGQEFTGVAVCGELRDGDLIFSNHRCHGHFLARTGDVEGLIAEVMGKRTGVCGGRGGSQHLCAGGFFSNGIQGGIVPVAAGLAFALKRRSTANISVVFIGDGTLGEGVLYEAMNIASKWELPLLIVLENNLYAQSTPQTQTLAGDICARAQAFGIASSHANTWDPLALVETAARCVEQVRRDGLPHFLRIDTHRLMAHSKGDDLRDKVEVEACWAQDAISRFIREEPEAAGEIQRQTAARVDAAVCRAQAEEYSVADDDTSADSAVTWSPVKIESPERIVNMLHAALRRNMERDERLVLIGEDIEGPYGGAFKVTKDLSREFPGRVRNTPISEAAIVGIGNGMALSGLRPVVELMFGDFLCLAADQIINHAAKFRHMYNNQVSVPLIVRTPMGGKRGYGPTHSQSLEKHFLGMPGTLMLALPSRLDPGLIYDRLFESVDRPVIVIENKVLYGLRPADNPLEGFALEQTDEMFPTIRWRPEAAADVTIVCYGGTLPEVEQAAARLFDEYEIVAEIICPVQLYPLNLNPIMESVKRTGRLLLVEEGLSFAAFGAEVVAALCERAPGALARVHRLASGCRPIPASGPLEKQLLPNPETIIKAACNLCSDP
ncbi:MAG: thiamine pyrophosphate-dependent enzyme [Verrucomicrobiota bacterium]|jgi:2-oxoisovalerate dehydrogenase E1 component